MIKLLQKFLDKIEERRSSNKKLYKFLVKTKDVVWHIIFARPILMLPFLLAFFKAVNFFINISDKKKRFPHYLSLCAVIKNEGSYLIEWIEYHRMMGVEHFFIYDNDSTDDTKQVLQPYIQKGIVDYKLWPGKAVQISSYNDCIKNNKNKSFWIGFIDPDEFIVPISSKNITEFIKDYESYNGLGISWIVYGSSGHKVKPNGLQIENYLYRVSEKLNSNEYVKSHIKSVVNPRKVIRSLGAHFFKFIDRGAVLDESKKGIYKNTNHNLFKKIRINHYYTRSKQEFYCKINRGKVTGEKKHNNPEALFDASNCNAEYDPIMKKYVSELKKRIETPL